MNGCQNVRLRPDAASVGMGLTWNFLYGVPSETDADYEILDQLPALAHFQPADASTWLAVER
ncbi:MAG TPA: hypothetical protein VFX70_10400 [Mycobacteriales bacterium]|nr:hypothetical protein [Mycobacteriales bacterium]